MLTPRRLRNRPTGIDGGEGEGEWSQQGGRARRLSTESWVDDGEPLTKEEEEAYAKIAIDEQLERLYHADERWALRLRATATARVWVRVRVRMLSAVASVALARRDTPLAALAKLATTGNASTCAAALVLITCAAGALPPSMVVREATPTPTPNQARVAAPVRPGAVRGPRAAPPLPAPMQLRRGTLRGAVGVIDAPSGQLRRLETSP